MFLTNPESVILLLLSDNEFKLIVVAQTKRRLVKKEKPKPTKLYPIVT